MAHFYLNIWEDFWKHFRKNVRTISFLELHVPNCKGHIIIIYSIKTLI